MSDCEVKNIKVVVHSPESFDAVSECLDWEQLTVVSDVVEHLITNYIPDEVKYFRWFRFKESGVLHLECRDDLWVSVGFKGLMQTLLEVCEQDEVVVTDGVNVF